MGSSITLIVISSLPLLEAVQDELLSYGCRWCDMSGKRVSLTLKKQESFEVILIKDGSFVLATSREHPYKQQSDFVKGIMG